MLRFIFELVYYRLYIRYEIIEKDEMDEPGEWKCEKGFDGAYGGII